MPTPNKAKPEAKEKEVEQVELVIEESKVLVPAKQEERQHFKSLLPQAWLHNMCRAEFEKQVMAAYDLVHESKGE